MDIDRVVGWVRTRDADGRFGFVKRDRGDRYFFHQSDCAGGAVPPVGERVSFRICYDEERRAPRASAVELFQPEPAEVE